jgi:ABC-type uncharacterized transport system permease subunit
MFSQLFRGQASLEKLEKASNVAVCIGLALFTVALYTGAELMHSLGHTNWYLEPQVLSSFATWLIFLVLAVGRLAGRWAGRTSAKIVLAGAALVVLTFFISHPSYKEHTTPSAPSAPKSPGTSEGKST